MIIRCGEKSGRRAIAVGTKPHRFDYAHRNARPPVPRELRDPFRYKTESVLRRNGEPSPVLKMPTHKGECAMKFVYLILRGSLNEGDILSFLPSYSKRGQFATFHQCCMFYDPARAGLFLIFSQQFIFLRFR